MKSEIRNLKSEIRAMARILSSVILTFAIALPTNARACAACYGASDSPMAQGMNWGIMALLVVVCGVLVAISVFFVHVARRAAALENAVTTELQPETK